MACLVPTVPALADGVNFFAIQAEITQLTLQQSQALAQQQAAAINAISQTASAAMQQTQQLAASLRQSMSSVSQTMSSMVSSTGRP